MDNSFLYPITFLPCKDLAITRNFYENLLQLSVALEQKSCILFKIGNTRSFAYWGFCSHYQDHIEPAYRVCLTLVVGNQSKVDDWHSRLLEKHVPCTRKPQYSTAFKIYNAFYSDPMGYTLEIQAFDNDAKPKL